MDLGKMKATIPLFNDIDDIVEEFKEHNLYFEKNTSNEDFIKITKNLETYLDKLKDLVIKSTFSKEDKNFILAKLNADMFELVVLDKSTNEFLERLPNHLKELYNNSFKILSGTLGF